MNSVIEVKEVSLESYMADFMPTLENFCSKSPAQPKIEYVKETGKVYLTLKHDLENPMIITLNPMVDKRDQIHTIKRSIEKEYPVIFEKKYFPYSPQEIERMVEEKHLSITEALGKRKEVFFPRYKIVRVHHKFNEIDCFDFKTRKLIKFKLYIPVVNFLDKYYEHPQDRNKNNDLFYSNKKFLYSLTKKDNKEKI